MSYQDKIEHFAFIVGREPKNNEELNNFFTKERLEELRKDLCMVKIL